ncbi:MAG: ATP-binding protein [Bacteroidales bacterium]|nr:ATP-binding protein [Bacteroidales bacterium]MDD2424398.1 ATP-binding protein [Bacteroidales bacterium]MDD3988980.1 ATP-binding protein [Bacteroidales bacterium]MDD4638790.1 ATP-binding protein [Bacteroidales bacterium]
MIERELQSVIEKKLFKGKAIIITGARQVGKTTLLKQFSEKFDIPVQTLNCDEPEVREFLTDTNTIKLSSLIGNYKIVMIDEAQRVKNIGLTLKLIVDNFKDVQLIVTGSSSLELGNEINEPLTGRKFEYTLYPVSSKELINNQGLLSEKKSFESRLIYGSYPDILNNPQDAKELLINIKESYLYKDLLSLEEIRRPDLLDKLLIALALQLSNEVSYNELSQIVNSDSKTVEKYIDLLEKCFVVFRLNAFNRNLRNELKKGKKIYFYDNGIRNAILQNFAPLGLRSDVGALWENYFICEKMKRNHYSGKYVNTYFWRTTAQQEIDLIEEADGQLSAYEMKWNVTKKVNFPQSFLKTYNIRETAVITPGNYLEFL